MLGTSLWFAVNAVMPDLQRELGWPTSAVGTLTSSLQFGFILGTLVFSLLAVADLGSFAAAAKAVTPATRRAISRSLKNIHAFAKKSLRKDWSFKNAEGATVGERFTPFDRVGVYVPGGKAPLVSTALMTAGFAQAAGVPEIIAASPHGRIDILKIDIEGAELDLFRTAQAWLAFVDCITIELHGDRAKVEIPDTLRAAGFSLNQHGSLTVAVRSPAPPKP